MSRGGERGKVHFRHRLQRVVDFDRGVSIVRGGDQLPI